MASLRSGSGITVDLDSRQFDLVVYADADMIAIVLYRWAVGIVFCVAVIL